MANHPTATVAGRLMAKALKSNATKRTQHAPAGTKQTLKKSGKNLVGKVYGI